MIEENLDYSGVVDELSYEGDVSMSVREHAADDALESALESRRTRGIDVKDKLEDYSAQGAV